MNQEDFTLLNALKDDLRFVLIVSTVKLVCVTDASEEKIVVSASTDQKCERCWHYRPDIGQHADHPTICERCISNLHGAGEHRHYA